MAAADDEDVGDDEERHRDQDRVEAERDVGDESGGDGGEHGGRLGDCGRGAKQNRRALRSNTNGAELWLVMPGLVPGIHVLKAQQNKDVDGRDKPGHDDVHRSQLNAIGIGPHASALNAAQRSER